MTDLVFLGSVVLAKAVGKALVNHLAGADLTSKICDEIIDLAGDQLHGQSAISRHKKEVRNVAKQIALRIHAIGGNTKLDHIDEEHRGRLISELGNALARMQIDDMSLMENDLDAHRIRSKVLEQPRRFLNWSGAELLYTNLVGHVCTVLVTMSPQLPGFELGFSKIVLQRLHTLTESYEERQRAGDEYEQEYRTQVVLKLNEVRLFGITPDLTNVPAQPLDLSFVQLHYSDVTTPAERVWPKLPRRKKALPYGPSIFWSEEDDDLPRTRTGSVDDLLHKNKRLLIRGEAGSGKTTLARWIAIRAAGRQFTGKLAYLNDCVPCYLELRDYVRQTKIIPPLSTFPEQLIPDLTPPDGWVQQQARKWRLLIILDGLDEVPQELRDDVLERVQDLVRLNPQTSFIITSRPTAVTKEQWPEWHEAMTSLEFRQASLERLTPEEAELLIYRWHASLAGVSSLDEETRRELPMLPRRLIGMLRTSPTLRQLATNPLLCAMICLTHREYKGDLAKRRRELYEQCLAVLLHGRDLKRKITLEPTLKRLSLEQKLEVVARLALWMFERGLTEVDQRQADREIFLTHVADLSIDNLTVDLLRDFYVERANLLQRPTKDRLAFVHRSFQEYLAAGVVEAGDGLASLRPHVTEDHWWEMIVLSVGRAKRKDAETFLDWLIVQGDHDIQDQQRLRLLALACLETTSFLSESLKSKILARAANFVPSNDDDARFLARAGATVVYILRYQQKHSEEQAVSCVTALSRIGTPEALQRLGEYARKAQGMEVSAWRVREALGRAWSSFDPQEFVDEVWRTCLRVVAPSPRFIAQLKQFTNGKELRLLEGEELTEIDELTWLHELYLGGTKVHNIAPLRQLVHLSLLDLSKTRISALGPLSSLRKLQVLMLRDTMVSDVEPLAELQELRELTIANTQVNDVKPLAALKKLQGLSLASTRVENLRPLIDLPELKHLYLYNTTVSETSVSDLRRANPRLSIHRHR